MAQKERQLKAIMFTDIVGYTAMMQREEDLAISYAQRHEDLLNQLVPKYNGAIFQMMGDGSLCLFDSAVAAVECARDIQISLTKKDYVPLRIGIHIGDIVIDGNKIYGDGVNLASRIESSGHAGTILLSSHVRDKIKNKGLRSQSVGLFELKNVSELMELFAFRHPDLRIVEKKELSNRVGRKNIFNRSTGLIILTISVLLIAMSINPSSRNYLINAFNLSQEDNIIRVAVFPFKTSGHEDVKYLGEGIVDIIHPKLVALEDINSLDPIITTSLDKKFDSNVMRISQESIIEANNIEFFVIGSILKIGELLKFTGRIINKKGISIEPIEVNIQSSEDLYLGIEGFVKLVIQSLYREKNLDFTDEALEETNNFEAFKEYIKGESNRRNGKFEFAQENYKKAVKLDSNFTLAWFRLFNDFGLYKDERDNRYKPSALITVIDSQITNLAKPFREYYLAYKKIHEGNILEGTNDLKQQLKIYGDNLDVMYLLADVIFHTNILFDKKAQESFPYFKKIISLTEMFFEADFHLNYYDALRRGDKIALEKFIEKYPNSDGISYSFINNYTQGLYDDPKPDTIINSWIKEKSIPNELFYCQNYDLVIKLFNDSLHRMNEVSDFYLPIILLLQGKFKLLNQNHTNYSTTHSFGWSFILSEPNFNPISDEWIDSLLVYLDNYERFDPGNWFHVAAKSIYYLLDGDLEKYTNSIDTMAKELNGNATSRNNSYLYYNYYRLKSCLARYNHENEKFINLQDSLFSNVLHLYNFASLVHYYYSIKFSLGEVKIEQNRIEEALTIYQNLDYMVGWVPFYIYAPIKFRLAYCYDKLGDNEKAYPLFKYFVTIYGDCDDFYQHNVEYARNKIREYEESIR